MKKRSELTEIGSFTSVGFPKFGMQGVPAKVDTGADSSSIWATNIQEVNGQLSFTIFDTFSPHFTGERITTDKYSLRSVKNSFGKSELRYKVILPVVIEGRAINVQFTLANRSNNRFPILIGRGTLQNKFIVNVAKTPKQSVTEVLVITNKHINSVSRFFDNIEQNTDRRMKFTVKTFDDLIFTIDKNRTQIKMVDDQKDVSKFDLIFIKTVGTNSAIAAALSQYARDHGVVCFDEALAYTPPVSKLQQYVTLAQNKISVPRSIYIAPSNVASSFKQIKDYVGLPFVFKDIDGEKGQNNYLITNKQSFLKACQAASKHNIRMIAQQNIPNDGDYRILVLGDNVELIIHRQANGKTHLNNTSAGGNAMVLKSSKIPAKVQAMAIKATGLLKWNIAGVDIVQDKTTNAWYCLEVNNSPQIASGAYVADKEVVFTEFLQKAARLQLKDKQ